MAALNSLPVINSTEQQHRRLVESPPPPAQAPMQRSIFPADSEQFGEQLATMGYERLIVLKAIQLFGKDEHKCIGTLIKLNILKKIF